MLKSARLYIYRLFSSLLPETSCWGVKRWLLRWAGAKIGKNVRICSSAKIIGSGELSIGDDTWIGQNVLIAASGKVQIGKNVDIAMLTFIGNGTHKLDFEGERCAGEGINLNVTIGNGCWLGARVTVLPGVEIDEMSMIGAGAVVTNKIPAKVVAVGIPAKILRHK